VAHLLHIDSSSSVHSVSRRLAASFRETWSKQQPDGTVTYRDLAAEPVPHMDTDAVVTLMAEPQTEGQRAAAALHNELVEEILEADALLISAPMYNWTIPSNLKAWLDQSLIMGRTLPFDPSVNPLAGRPATVVLAHGGDYTAGSPDADMDHCTPYLRTVAEKVLGYQVEFVIASYTVTPYTTEDPAELEKAANSLRQAESAVLDRARSVASGLVRA
jgi:FMN-dependent NADH-azoreductase